MLLPGEMLTSLILFRRDVTQINCYDAFDARPLSHLTSRGRPTVADDHGVVHLLTLFRSVVGRVLNGSFWPTILRTDTAATTKVSKRVLLLSTLSTAGLFLLGLVSIITPLELYENISQFSFREVEFGYTPDLQPMGKGTPPRMDYNVSRLCGHLQLINCPGQGHGFNFSWNATGIYRYWNDDHKLYMSSVVPSNITEIFSSGSEGDRNRVAGAFDIEYRTFILASDSERDSTHNPKDGPGPNIDQGRKRTRAAFQMYESLILNDQVNLVEGLVVDTKAGGIGFRNHTAPLDPGNGSKWTEGLLWIEPETICVSTNLSVDYTVSQASSLGNENDLVLTDQGGFFGLATDYPLINLNDTQKRPELLARAHKGAVCQNSNLMRFFGVDRNETAIGKSYALNSSATITNRISIDHFNAEMAILIPGVIAPLGNSSVSTNTKASDMYIDVCGFF